MKHFYALFICCLLSITTFAQTEIPASKEKKIRQLMDLTGSGKMGVQAATSIIAMYKERYTDVPADVWQKFQDKIKADEIVELVIPIYAKYFTESDLDDLIGFYKTPIGQKLLSATPQIMQESMQAGRIWGEKISKEIISELISKGYEKGA